MRKQVTQKALAFGLEDGGSGALSFGFAFAKEDHLGLELEGFIYVMADGKRRDATIGEPGAHSGEEFVAESAIDAGERLIEEHEAAAWGGEGSGEVDALALTTGEVAGEARGEGLEAKKGKGFRDVWREAGGAGGKLDVFADRKVGEEGRALRSPAQVTEVGWSVLEVGWSVSEVGWSALEEGR